MYSMVWSRAQRNALTINHILDTSTLVPWSMAQGIDRWKSAINRTLDFLSGAAIRKRYEQQICSPAEQRHLDGVEGSSMNEYLKGHQLAGMNL
jgi:hypothetical protein